MKTLIIIVGLFIGLSSCKKEEKFCWECEWETITSDDICCFTYCDMTEEEIHEYLYTEIYVHPGGDTIEFYGCTKQ